MATEQTEAIVLRVIPWSETSLIVHLYSRDFGKLSVLAKGARRPKSPFEAALDLLSICRVVFIGKSSDALDILTEAKLQRRYRAGERDLLRLYAAYYVAELLDRLTDQGDQQPEIYELATATLLELSQPASQVAGLVLRWELQMLRLTGHLPSWQRCGHCGQAVVPSSAQAPSESTRESSRESSSQRAAECVFGVLAGGVLCSDCQRGARHMIRLPQAARAELEWFSRSQWRELDTSLLNSAHRSVIRGVMTRYLTVLLDRKLQMHPYLEELGR